MKKLVKNTILITGATGGIGKATALELARRGATILAVGRNRKNLAALQRKIAALGGGCETYRCDVSRHTDVKTLAAQVRKRHKTISWVIQSAGYLNRHESMEPANTKVLQTTFAVNTFAPIEIAQLFLPHVERGGFINISSTAGIWGNVQYPAYSASKGAVNTYGRVLAKACAAKKLACITLAPGATNTPMMVAGTKAHQEPEAVAIVVRKIVTGTSQYVNGDLIVVRNGKSRVYRRL